MTEPYSTTDEHRHIVHRVGRGECTAAQAVARTRHANNYDMQAELDYVRAELRHRCRENGRMSRTIGQERNNFDAYRAQTRHLESRRDLAAECRQLRLETDRLDAAHEAMTHQHDALYSRVADLADDLQDLLQTYAWANQDGTWLGYAEFVAGKLREALGPAETARPAPQPFRAPVAPQVVQADMPAPDTEDNPDAARILGKRHEDVTGSVLVVNMPCEEGFHCPVCIYPAVVDGEFDERLAWSEYRTMLWCHECERDYPSALCIVGDPSRATQVYLSSVEQVVTARSAVARSVVDLNTPAVRRRISDLVNDHLGGGLIPHEGITSLVGELFVLLDEESEAPS